jgi:acyl-CoA reductase-like NAD-dependent aldehyde dehydrogenase
VLVSARTFVAALCESGHPILLHYLGSSAHASEILSAGFRAGKQVIIDGEGNAWVWVDGDVSPDRACDLLTSGALRYNGQTCTSVNGAIIHPGIYDQVRKCLAARWSGITFGNPLEADVQVGPLMTEEQAEQCLARIDGSGGKVVVGGHRSRNLLSPTLVANPAEDSELVSDGVFGNALWIAPGDMNFFAQLWGRNRYPLCAGILSGSADHRRHIRALPGLARLTVNGDPSLEYLYEPWGGYPASGMNGVGHWHHKYLRTVQVDHPTQP